MARVDRAKRGAGEAQALGGALSVGRTQTGFGLRRDLQSLWLMVNASTAWVAALRQAACALGDHDFKRDLARIETWNERQRAWLLDRIKQAAPQTLTVPSSEGGVP